MNKALSFFVGILVGLIVGVGGYWAWQKYYPVKTTTTTYTVPASSSDDLITYQANDQLFSVVKNTISVATVLNPAYWAGADAKHDQQFYQNLLAKYQASDTGMQYVFTYKGVSQDSGVYAVTVIPNKLGYTTTDAFLKDFPADSAGAPYYASVASASNLLFVPSCSTGFDDGSGKPHGCDLVQAAVEPTIKLK